MLGYMLDFCEYKFSADWSRFSEQEQMLLGLYMICVCYNNRAANKSGNIDECKNEFIKEAIERLE